MRIAHFIATNFVGGPERQILNHVSRLLPMGHQVLLLSFDEPGGVELRKEAEKRGLRCELLRPGKWAIASVLRDLTRLNDEWRPELVCAHGYKPAFYAILLRARRGCRFVAFSRGWTSENFKIRLYGLLDRLLIRFADAIVAVSNSQRQRLLRAWIPADRIKVVENALTVSPQKPEHAQNTDSHSLRAELDLPAGAPLILAAGRLSPEKGYEYLLAAVAEVHRKIPDVLLLLAGSGMLDAALRAQANALGIAARVRFLGFRKDILALYRVADVFALSSLSEGLPNVILESMAIGVPVVATRVGGVPEIIEDGRSGLLVAPRAPRPLAEALISVLRDRALAARLAAQAKSDVVSRFDPDQQTHRLLQIYQQALAN